MSNTVDVYRLIAEVQKRPALWDIRHGDHKTRHSAPKMWQEVAQNIGIDVEKCKRKWKNLRDAYRAELKRSERRIERDKFMGTYDPNTNYTSKWMYFLSLSFISESDRDCNYHIENESTNSNSNDNNYYDQTYNENIYDENAHGNIKLERSRDKDNDVHLVEDDDEDAANDKLFEEFQNIATPRAARRLSATLSINNPLEHISFSQQANTISSTSKANACECTKRNDEQVHFLEDLGRQEQRLMKSTRQDITRYNNSDHIGDSDYNFLVSFLPNMKKMSEMQNLQFRAKMCDMVLNILAPTITGNTPNAGAITEGCSNQLTANVKENQ